MKRILTLFALSLSFLMSGQEYYTFEAVTSDTGNGEAASPMVRLLVNKVSLELAMDDWQKFFKKDEKNEVIVLEKSIDVKKVVLNDVSSMPLDIFAKFQDKPEGLEVKIYVKDSLGAIDVENHVNGYAYEKKVRSFASQIYVHQLNIDLKDEKSHYDKLEKEASKIQKGIDKLQKQKINLEVDLSGLGKEEEFGYTAYDDILNEINMQKSVVAKTPKDAENYKLVKKELDGLEKRKKEIDKEIKKNKELAYDTKMAITAIENQIVIETESYTAMDAKVVQQRNLVLKIEEEIYEVAHR